MEEDRFHETLNDGLEILTKLMEAEKEKGSTIFPGEEVFRLYDTYGFPKELTEEYVEKLGFTVNQEGFENEMKLQRERARNARQKVDSMQVQDTVFSTIDVESEFVGYSLLEKETVIQAIIQGKETTESAEAGQEAYILLKETPFYAESGGQVADIGFIQTDHAYAVVTDVQKSPNGQHIHRVEVKEGVLQVGSKQKRLLTVHFGMMSLKTIRRRIYFIRH